MGSLKLSVHPLFFPLGFYFALTNKIFLFVIYTLSAVMHEIGHSIVANGLGYKLNEIVLMPFGAVVKGNVDGLSLLDEFKVSLAGPITNIVIAVFFVATWWIFPTAYAYTDVVAEANLSLAVVNLLPVLPLDGGRALFSIVSYSKNEKTAKRICVVISVIFVLLLFSLFIFSCFKSVNLTILFFALFILFGLFDGKRQNRYVKIARNLKKEDYERGLPYVKTALENTATVKKVINVLQKNAINEIVVFSDGKKIKVLSQEDIERIIMENDIYKTLENVID
ncbi:MAG: site-2 protease family protein [Clostridia bacterium]|nr:site-2 protease family protein [Clostridia bacterium]